MTINLNRAQLVAVLLTSFCLPALVFVFFGIFSNTSDNLQSLIEKDSYLVDHSLHNMNHATITSQKQFLYEMIPHHEEAVVTSNYILENSNSLVLKDFARAVIKAQSTEIEDMKTWYKAWYNEDYIDNPGYMLMMGDLTQFEGTELDNQYITGMIDHHIGAIMMAEGVLENIENDEVKTLAENIIKSQTAEVEFLKSLLK